MIPRLSNAVLAASRLSGADGNCGRQMKVHPLYHPGGLRVQRCADAVPRNFGHVEAETAQGHAMRFHVLRPCAARWNRTTSPFLF